MSSPRPRRSSVSIYDYPEHLNPFNDDTTSSQPQMRHEIKSSKESRHKFWTFGRSRKKRSNSFSIKSTWNGLFGKRKETTEPMEKRSTITTVSTTYKRQPYDKPIAPPRLSKDHQEFDEALGTLTRRKKHTLNNSASRYSSNLTVNGDFAKISDGHHPQDTTTSIMGVDLTPKPPARRFGQVSPRPTDKIPPLNFEDKQNGTVSLDNRSEETPVPPLRRFGVRSSQRLNGTASDLEDDSVTRASDAGLRDENENMAEDYIFKRFSQDAVRRSNLSINSCVSVTSTASTYRRKKRRAPDPPKQKEQLEASVVHEDNGRSATEANKTTTESTPDTSTSIELQITEPISIIAADSVNEMTSEKNHDVSSREETKRTSELLAKTTETVRSDNVEKIIVKNEANEVSKKDPEPEIKIENDPSEEKAAHSFDETSEETESETTEEKSNKKKKSDIDVEDNVEKNHVDIEYERTSQEKMEIIKDIEEDFNEVCLRKKDGGSSSALSPGDNFSVKEEIEKIERQIKALESKNADEQEEETVDARDDESTTNARLSIQANRRNFFENMVDGPSGPIKLEFKKLPCEQKDIHVVRLTDPPVPVAAPRDPVKVIELHISEPIRHKPPEILDEVNPIPKPRRHSALSLKDVSESRLSKERSKSPDDINAKRGKSF
ncbi:uncharacterized protein LOC109858943 [Pseudomyrmex gracilis]|uniref:uncharacterized protein LOC109858943 n=1 Tax=Pseudomyrmex gracilis TaxID=219809 RepID=UPI0009953866|nr:uncharacterized protein LOC109858943 [Pseudomyrmex gracilis]XP_020292261.1 uncharacterized protein LOC109858943 [Pseudomyrmex gracilis]